MYIIPISTFRSVKILKLWPVGFELSENYIRFPKMSSSL